MPNFPSADHTLVRQMNLASVLSYLHQGGPLSRAQLALQTNLNKSTISSLVEDLIHRGLVREHGIDASGAGRPSTLLKLNPQAGCLIGVEIGVGFLSAIVTNFIGEVLWRRYEELGLVTKQERVLPRTFEIVDEAVGFVRKNGERLLGLGITVPGMVDVEQSVLVFSPNLQWRDVPLRDMFQQHTGAPVFVDNDANAAALGEHLFGVARQAQHFIFVVASVGVGGGLFLNGDIYRGAIGLAGEIGHTSMSVDYSRPCRCGNWGCWENSANQSSLIERVRARLEVGRPSLIREMLEKENSPLTLSIIFRAAEAGDVEAQQALKETGAAIGLGVANMIDIFDPQMVVIGGALSAAGKFILPAIQEVVSERSLNVAHRRVEIAISAFERDASVMGAVAMVKQKILSNPLTVSPISSRDISVLN